MCQLSLDFSQPAGGQGEVWQQIHGNDCHTECDSSFDAGHAVSLKRLSDETEQTYMKSHRQPARPWTLFRVLNVAAAIRPEKEVAIMLPEYKIDSRVAISLRV